MRRREPIHAPSRWTIDFRRSSGNRTRRNALPIPHFYQALWKSRVERPRCLSRFCLLMRDPKPLRRSLAQLPGSFLLGRPPALLCIRDPFPGFGAQRAALAHEWGNSLTSSAKEPTYLIQEGNFIVKRRNQSIRVHILYRLSEKGPRVCQD